MFFFFFIFYLFFFIFVFVLFSFVFLFSFVCLFVCFFFVLVFVFCFVCFPCSLWDGKKIGQASLDEVKKEPEKTVITVHCTKLYKYNLLAITFRSCVSDVCFDCQNLDIRIFVSFIGCTHQNCERTAALCVKLNTCM